MNQATATIPQGYGISLPRVRCGLHQVPDFSPLFGEDAQLASFRYAVYGDTCKPALLVLGGISADCFPFDAEDLTGSVKGWWQPLLGGAHPSEHSLLSDIDSLLAHFCVIGIEFWAAEQAGKALKISTFDQARLINHWLESEQIESLACLIGCSYGGMVGLALCQQFPNKVASAIILCAADEANAKATASRVLQRRIVELGLATGATKEALAIARSLAMVSYRGAEEIQQRFANQIDPERATAILPIEGYFDYHGERFARRFNPWRFLNLSQSIDLHKVEPEKISVPLTLIGFEEDQVVPPDQMISMQKRLAAASPYGETPYIGIQTPYGHDGFLKETEQLRPIIEAALIGSRRS